MIVGPVYALWSLRRSSLFGCPKRIGQVIQTRISNDRTLNSKASSDSSQIRTSIWIICQIIMLRMMTTPTAPSMELIEARIATLRDQLSAHPLYSSISKPEHLRLFMESHVFAVWDFMSLLKALQRALTCVDLLWVPTAYPASRRFINSIVLGEESDEYEGRPMSHFEIYLEAMERAGASTDAIRHVLTRVPQGLNLDGIPVAARRFVETTFRIIQKGSLAAQAAALTFGREDAIPSMFQSLVRDLNRKMGGDLTQFIWYLERHIELDGNDHGPASLLHIGMVSF
jgi:Protein of unknown function (DUF3050)